MPQIAVYVINLDRAPERLSHMERQLAAIGRDFTRITAIDGSEVNLADPRLVDLSAYHAWHGKHLNQNEVGCYLSHYKAIGQFLTDQKPFGLILEDDAVLPAKLPILLAELISCRQDWDMVKLSANHSGSPIMMRKLSNQWRLSIALTRTTSALAYLLNRRAAEKYSQHLLPMRVPYDHEYDLAWRYKISVRSIYAKPICPIKDTPSTINTTPLLGKKFPWWRRGSVVLYRTKIDIFRFFYALIIATKHQITRHKL